MSEFAHDKVMPDPGSGLQKKQQVAQMFNGIAARYDFINRFLTAGTDIRWRKKMLAELKEVHPRQMLDVATGTADVAIMAFRILRPEHITGIDISEGMLELGRQKVGKLHLSGRISLEQGDSERLAFGDDRFDAVTVAFGVRNFEHLETGLSEMLRVLRPGGKLAVLEFSRPVNPVFRMLCNFYMDVVTPAVGRLFARDHKAYRYLTNSVQAFPEGQTFVNVLQRAGFSHTYLKRLSLGICTIYCGMKQ